MFSLLFFLLHLALALAPPLPLVNYLEIKPDQEMIDVVRVAKHGKVVGVSCLDHPTCMIEQKATLSESAKCLLGGKCGCMELILW